MPKVRLSILAVAAIDALLPWPTPAHAVGPDMLKFPVDNTRPVPASETGCAFDIVRHSEGTF